MYFHSSPRSGMFWFPLRWYLWPRAWPELCPLFCCRKFSSHFMQKARYPWCEDGIYLLYIIYIYISIYITWIYITHHVYITYSNVTWRLGLVGLVSMGFSIEAWETLPISNCIFCSGHAWCDAEDCRLVRGALDGVWRYYEVTSKAPVETAAAANDGFVWKIKGLIKGWFLK